MAFGSLQLHRLELMLSSGVWTDLTPDLDPVASVEVRRPRPLPGRAPEPTTLTATLLNPPDDAGIARWTPDNPLGPLWSTPPLGRRIRWQVGRTAAGTYTPQTSAESATAAFAGTTSRLIATDANAAGFRQGDLVQLFTSGGALKSTTVHTLTAPSSGGGLTNLDFTPAAGVATAAGDVMRQVHWTRFVGWVDGWDPDTSSGNDADAVVTVRASGILARYARRRMRSDYFEAVEHFAGADTWDAWPMDDGDTATVLQNMNTAGYDALVVPSKDGLGEITLTDSPPTTGPLIDGHATFARTSDVGGTGPVILARLQAGNDVQRVSAWTQLTVDPVTFDDCIVGFTAAGSRLWRFGPALTAGTIRWQLRDGADTVLLEYNLQRRHDDAWRWFGLLFYESGGLPVVSLAVRDRYHDDEILTAALIGTGDPRLTRWLSVGGLMAPQNRGANQNTFMGSIGGLYVHYNALKASTSYLAAPGRPFTSTDRAARLAQVAAEYDAPLGGGVGAAVTDTTAVAVARPIGRSLLETWAEFSRTIGGSLGTTPDGRRVHRTAAASRSHVVSLTLDASADLDMPTGGWALERRDQPTRISVTSPAGTATKRNPVAEALLGLRVDEVEGVATAAGTKDVAATIAALMVAGSGRARLRSFGVDLMLTGTDRWIAAMNLQPGSRVRVSGLPASTGVQHADVFASGWTERYRHDGVKFVFDCDPADDPPEGVFDHAEYGRWAMGDGAATVVAGTAAAGTTSTGTLTISSTSPLTVNAASYPLDLDWNGERVTVTSPPASSTSPQTVTVTARGVAPSIAREHQLGEPIDIWQAARWAP